MYSDWTVLMIARARHKEMLQEAERQRLFRTAGFRQPANMGRLWQVANRLGARIIKWGLKLQGMAQRHYLATVKE
jgi:hypothetical protein